METNSLQELLNAEEQANRLIKELARLKKEGDSYQTASKALSETSGGLSKLSDQLGGISEGIAQIVEKMRKLGTPQILDGQQGISSEMKTIREEIAGLATASSSEELKQKLEKSTDSTAKQVTGISESLSKLMQKLEASSDAASKQVSELSDMLSSQIETVVEVQSIVRVLCIVGMGISIAGFGILALLILRQ